MPNLLTNSIRSILLFIMASSIVSCYEPESGCLDLLANNYDVSSDKACDDCCTYPSFVIQMNHSIGDTSFSFGDTLTNNIGSSFTFLNQKFYLSDWTYTMSDGKMFKSRDSISLEISDNEIFVKKDITIIRQNQSSATNHTYKREGTLTNINFTQGLPNYLNSITSDVAEEYSPLSFDNDLYRIDKYESHWLQLGVGSQLTDTIDIYFEEDTSYSIPLDTMLQKGKNVGIPISLVYDSLFANINFEMSSATEIKNQIQSNKTKWIQ